MSPALPGSFRYIHCLAYLRQSKAGFPPRALIFHVLVYCGMKITRIYSRNIHSQKNQQCCKLGTPAGHAGSSRGEAGAGVCCLHAAPTLPTCMTAISKKEGRNEEPERGGRQARLPKMRLKKDTKQRNSWRAPLWIDLLLAPSFHAPLPCSPPPGSKKVGICHTLQA